MLTRAVPTYDALRDLCHEISEGGQISSAKQREQRKARIYWEIGDAIHSHLLRHEGKPRYGDRLYPRLARDLKMTRSQLYTIVHFRQRIPNVHTCEHLAWSHCRLLLPLKSAAEREFYARAARQADWSVDRLKEAIVENRYDQARQIGSSAYLENPASPASLSNRYSVNPTPTGSFAVFPARSRGSSTSALVTFYLSPHSTASTNRGTA